MVATVLAEAGFRTGLYTSPHLIDFTERIRVNGVPIPPMEAARLTEKIRAASPDRPVTFFEFTTAMAFLYFAESAVDFVAAETGMGGRYDATNVLTPDVTVITPIDFDHQRYLGSTLAEIAGEKAGIIKPGVPVVVGDVVPKALAVISRIAHERGAELIRASGTERDYGPLHLGLRGEHQLANARVAMRVVETLERLGVTIGAEAIVDGLTNVRWPGRLEHRTLPDGREVILDAAHNPAGAAALASYLRSLEGGGAKPALVFAAMRDKDVDGMLTVLLPAIGHVVVTRPSNPRAADPEELASRIRALDPSLAVEVVAAPGAAVERAARISARVVVAGSIFLLGDVMLDIGARC